MNLAKPRVDIGLNTNALEPMLAFWQRDVGAGFDHVLAVQAGVRQHRHDIRGSVLKINHYRDPIAPRPPAGYRELYVARDGVVGLRPLKDPDGNCVTLIPPGTFGIGQIAIKLGVRDVAAHRRFYTAALGLEEISHPSGAGFRAGETLLLIEQATDAPSHADIQGFGWRYITFQVFQCDEEHARILAHGGSEALSPRTLGTTARISMVRDPDGNWIEISQRASIVGALG